MRVGIALEIFLVVERAEEAQSSSKKLTCQMALFGALSRCECADWECAILEWWYQ